MTASYSDLQPEDQVILAIEYVLRGAPVPKELEKLVGPDVMYDIRLPLEQS